MCRSNCLRSLCHIAIYQETFFGEEEIKACSRLLADMEGCRNKVFSLQAMSHCHKLRYSVLDASFFNTIFASVNPNFCFLLYLNVKKVILLLNANNFYKLLVFLMKAILPLICWPFFLGVSHIHLACIYHIKAASVSIILHFPERQLYCQYVVEKILSIYLIMSLFWTF